MYLHYVRERVDISNFHPSMAAISPNLEVLKKGTDHFNDQVYTLGIETNRHVLFLVPIRLTVLSLNALAYAQAIIIARQQPRKEKLKWTNALPETYNLRYTLKATIFDCNESCVLLCKYIVDSNA